MRNTSSNLLTPQAFKDLAKYGVHGPVVLSDLEWVLIDGPCRGEQTATAMEKNLSSLEKKIDALLASVEANEKEAEMAKKGKSEDGGSKHT